MIEVILPVLNERQALPWVLSRMPDGYAPLVVDNGSTDGSGALAAELEARVVAESRPGFDAACAAVADPFDRALGPAGVLVQAVLDGIPGKRRSGQLLGSRMDLDR